MHFLHIPCHHDIIVAIVLCYSSLDLDLFSDGSGYTLHTGFDPRYILQSEFL